MLNWSVSKTIDFYKHYSQKYDNEITPNSYPAPSLLASWVNNYLSFSPAFILDVGCGTGQSSKLFLNDNLKYSVTGIDASPDMLKIAQKYPFKKLLCQNITDPLQTDGILYNAILCGTHLILMHSGCFGFH
ncbi:S-adenosyl-L-methionine-dependent methyltransferase [Globomyces pollinis-pini]|nr:S-adenosyl-L-methionine-dependent methyltransferase [Globomyces pollinis-pini]